MFFIDKPYVSDFFKTTVRDNNIPVVATVAGQAIQLHQGSKRVSEAQAVAMAQASDNLLLYTTSENSIGWIAQNFPFSDIPNKIELFKNKGKFRELTQSLFPELYFTVVRTADLQNFRVNGIPMPFIIKPAVGFFSMGVYKVSSHLEWDHTVESILREIDHIKDLYPEEVLDTGSFIIEQCIQGDEFAIDAYFNATGEPVIVGIFQHAFSSDADVSDRVYLTSKNIIEENHAEFTDFAGKIGALAGVKNFPVHIELRRESNGTLLPIEVNPMRFGGWCSTPDMSFAAYGINPYLCYYLQKKPDWAKALQGKERKLFSLVVLDNSTGIEGKEIESFDYEKLLSRFEKPMELRKINYKEYPVFGFLFTETREDNFMELQNILDSDLIEFILPQGSP